MGDNMKKKSNIGWWIAGLAGALLLKKKAAAVEGIGRAAKYKLIVEGDWCGRLTGEYDNLAANLKDAERIARKLLKEYGGEYSCHVSCYDIRDDIRNPYCDYRVWRKDYFGDEHWAWMRVSDYGGRLGIYIK